MYDNEGWIWHTLLPEPTVPAGDAGGPTATATSITSFKPKKPKFGGIEQVATDTWAGAYIELDRLIQHTSRQWLERIPPSNTIPDLKEWHTIQLNKLSVQIDVK